MTTKKPRTKDGKKPKTPTENVKMLENASGITPTTNGRDLTKLTAESTVSLHATSITPFPNIDQVKSESTNLIDESTKQLKDLMKSLTKQVTTEENLFKSVNSVNAACNCAKQISSLIRVKLDIYKEYKKKMND